MVTLRLGGFLLSLRPVVSLSILGYFCKELGDRKAQLIPVPCLGSRADTRGTRPPHTWPWSSSEETQDKEFSAERLA